MQDLQGFIQGFVTLKFVLQWNRIESPERASLVAQWLRIHLPMQETRVQALVQEDPTCHGTTKPMCHHY